MEREQTTIRLPVDEVKGFIKYIKGLNEEQQAGLCLTLEGLRILADKQKSGIKNR